MEKMYYTVRDLVEELHLSYGIVYRLIKDTVSNPIRARDGSFKFTKEEFDKIVAKGEERIPIPEVIHVFTHIVWEVYPSKMNYMRIGKWIKEEQG